MKIRDWLYNRIIFKKRFKTIQIVDDGFILTANESSVLVKWDEITSIEAFKKDQLSIDQICLNVICAQNQYLITEDYSSWNLFKKEMHANLPQINKDWVSDIAKPAFKENKTKIFVKPISTQSYKCTICGEEHDEWPALAYSSPDNYAGLTHTEQSTITEIDEDFCVITYPDQTDRFIKTTLVQKVIDFDSDLDYGLWVSLSEKSFNDYKQNFDNSNHETSYFGWLCNGIPGYAFKQSIPMTVWTKTGSVALPKIKTVQKLTKLELL